MDPQQMEALQGVVNQLFAGGLAYGQQAGLIPQQQQQFAPAPVQFMPAGFPQGPPQVFPPAMQQQALAPFLAGGAPGAGGQALIGAIIGAIAGAISGKVAARDTEPSPGWPGDANLDGAFSVVAVQSTAVNAGTLWSGQKNTRRRHIVGVTLGAGAGVGTIFTYAFPAGKEYKAGSGKEVPPLAVAQLTGGVAQAPQIRWVFNSTGDITGYSVAIAVAPGADAGTTVVYEVMLGDQD